MQVIKEQDANEIIKRLVVKKLTLASLYETMTAALRCKTPDDIRTLLIDMIAVDPTAILESYKKKRAAAQPAAKTSKKKSKRKFSGK